MSGKIAVSVMPLAPRASSHDMVEMKSSSESMASTLARSAVIGAEPNFSIWASFIKEANKSVIFCASALPDALSIIARTCASASLRRTINAPSLARSSGMTVSLSHLPLKWRKRSSCRRTVGSIDEVSIPLRSSDVSDIEDLLLEF